MSIYLYVLDLDRTVRYYILQFVYSCYTMYSSGYDLSQRYPTNECILNRDAWGTMTCAILSYIYLPHAVAVQNKCHSRVRGQRTMNMPEYSEE